MDDLERRKVFEALKAKARQQRSEKDRQVSFGRKLTHMRFDKAKTNAANEYVLKALESQDVKHLNQIDNRPAEKVVKGTTKGTKKHRPSSGPSI